MAQRKQAIRAKRNDIIIVDKEERLCQVMNVVANSGNTVILSCYENRTIQTLYPEISEIGHFESD